MSKLEQALTPQIPFNDAADFFVRLKTAGWTDPPDTSGALEGMFLVPVEQVLDKMKSVIAAKARLMLAWYTYAQSFKGEAWRAIKEEFHDHAEDEQRGFTYYSKRAAALAGPIHMDPVEPPPPASDPSAIFNIMARAEQEGILAQRELRDLVGEQNPMKVGIEEHMALDQHHLDEMWQMMSQTVGAILGPPPTGAAPIAPEEPVPQEPPEAQQAPTQPPPDKEASARFDLALVRLQKQANAGVDALHSAVNSVQKQTNPLKRFGQLFRGGDRAQLLAEEAKTTLKDFHAHAGRVQRAPSTAGLATMYNMADTAADVGRAASEERVGRDFARILPAYGGALALGGVAGVRSARKREAGAKTAAANGFDGMDPPTAPKGLGGQRWALRASSLTPEQQEDEYRLGRGSVGMSALSGGMSGLVGGGTVGHLVGGRRGPVSTVAGAGIGALLGAGINGYHTHAQNKQLRTDLASAVNVDVKRLNDGDDGGDASVVQLPDGVDDQGAMRFLESHASGLMNKHRAAQGVKAAGVADVAPAFGGLSAGYSMGGEAANATARAVAPKQQEDRAGGIARRVAHVAAPVAGIGAMVAAHKLKAVPRALGALNRFSHAGTIADPAIEQEIAKLVVPAGAALGGSVLGGAAAGGAAGALTHAKHAFMGGPSDGSLEAPPMGALEGEPAPFAGGENAGLEAANYLEAEQIGREAQEENEAAYYRERFQQAMQQLSQLQARAGEAQASADQMQQQQSMVNEDVSARTNQAVEANVEATRQAMSAANLRIGLEKMRQQLIQVVSQDPELLAQPAALDTGMGDPAMGGDPSAQAPGAETAPGAAPAGAGEAGQGPTEAQNASGQPGTVVNIGATPNSNKQANAGAHLPWALGGAVAGGALGLLPQHARVSRLRDQIGKLESSRTPADPKSKDLAANYAQLTDAEKYTKGPLRGALAGALAGGAALGMVGPTIARNVSDIRSQLSSL